MSGHYAILNTRAKENRRKKMKKEVTYFKGDKAEYTGKVVNVYGGTFNEIKMLEGTKKGEKLLKKA